MLFATATAGLLNAWFSRQTHAADIRPIAAQNPSSLHHKILLGYTLFLLTACCALPLLAIVVQATQAGSAWRVLWHEDTLAALWNTLRFSAIALFGTAVLGILHAAAARAIPLFRSITFLPFMISPVCLSFGALLAYPQHAGSLHLLLALYVLLAYPFVTKDVLATWDALPHRYFQAAQVFGASPIQTLWHITLPLLRPALRRGLTFAAATSIGEFAATLFLSRPEWQTLTTLIYYYLSKVGSNNYGKAMVLTLLLMTLATLVFVLLDTQESHKKSVAD